MSLLHIFLTTSAAASVAGAGAAIASAAIASAVVASVSIAGAGVEAIDGLASLGAAGVMGAMWLWERHNSQKRENQIDDAHARIMGDRVQLEQLMSVVRQNAEAISRLCATHDQLLRQLGRNERSSP